MSAYASRYVNACELLSRAKESIVGGVKRMNMLDDPEQFPLFIERGKGAEVWDIDGNRYIDLIAGKGSIIVGYAASIVDGGVVAAIERGSMLPLTTSLYVDTAERVCSCVTTLEKVKFFRSGSCAVSAAVRLCRVKRGTRLILSSGYHGWHDWYIEGRCSYPNEHSDVIDFHYSLDALARMLKVKQSQVAAIVVTPEPALIPPQQIADIASLARSYSIPFVLDEMKTGFRCSLGGYQQAIGLKPDISTFGKAMANGYACSAVGGRTEIMNAELETHISGTYETENIGLAATSACIGALATFDYNKLATLYHRFIKHLNESFRRKRVPALCVGAYNTAQIIFKDPESARAFYRAAANNGVLFYCFDDINLTFAHESLLEELLSKIDTAIERLAPESDALMNKASILAYLKGHKIVSKSESADGEVVSLVAGWWGSQEC